MAMEAGRLRQRVQLLKRSRTQGSMGGGQIQYTPEVTVYGALEELRGTEFYEAQKFSTEITAVIKIRYRKGIDSTYRAIVDGVIYEIIAPIDPFHRKEDLHLMVKKLPMGERD